jgi:hypothetical protein
MQRHPFLVRQVNQFCDGIIILNLWLVMVGKNNITKPTFFSIERKRWDNLNLFQHRRSPWKILKPSAALF